MLKPSPLLKKWVPRFILYDPAPLGPRPLPGKWRSELYLRARFPQLQQGPAKQVVQEEFMVEQELCIPRKENYLGTLITLEMMVESLIEGQKNDPHPEKVRVDL